MNQYKEVVRSLGPNFSLGKSGFLNARVFRFVTAWLDEKGILTSIKKTKRVRLYNIYMTDKDQYRLVATRKTRQSAKLYIYRKFLEEYSKK